MALFKAALGTQYFDYCALLSINMTKNFQRWFKTSKLCVFHWQFRGICTPILCSARGIRGHRMNFSGSGPLVSSANAVEIRGDEIQKGAPEKSSQQQRNRLSRGSIITLASLRTRFRNFSQQEKVYNGQQKKRSYRCYDLQLLSCHLLIITILQPSLGRIQQTSHTSAAFSATPIATTIGVAVMSRVRHLVVDIVRR